jgi:hypothetical protein
MGAYAGPDIVESGLVLALDAGNTKSLNIPTQADHGYADWYCLVSGTVTYSIINSTGGVIYERNGSTVTTMVTATVPQRGTFSVTAGRFYYGSVPINLVLEDGHERMAPLTMVGTQFWCVAARDAPSTYYVYSPYQATTVNFYDNTVGGLTGTATSTISLSAGQSGTFTSNNLTNHWISSSVPIIATATQTGWDKTILSPMSTYVYQRFQNNFGTTNFTTPTNNNAYVTYDSTYKVMNMSIADGSGGDCAQGLGLEYLSDTYSWGNVVSDYTMVFPYNGTFTASYWSGTAWVVWDTHTVTTGSITNPPSIARDGSTGVGIAATNIAGFASNMASGATLWKWEGTAPFYLNINDNADDEFSVLGWLSSRNTSPRSSNVITDITGRGNNGTLTNNPVFTLVNGGSLAFDGVDDYVEFGGTARYFTSYITQQITIETWLYVPSSATWSNGFYGNIVTRGYYGGSHGLFRTTTNNQVSAWFRQPGGFVGGGQVESLGTIVRDTWNQLVAIWKAPGSALYINGQLSSQNSTALADLSAAATDDFWYIGRNTAAGGAEGNYFTGNQAQTKIYNRALTATEIAQNFNATRSRYGI